MSEEAIKQFIEDARAVSIETAAKIMRLTVKRSGFEHAKPCPNCAGTDEQMELQRRWLVATALTVPLRLSSVRAFYDAIRRVC